MKNSNFKKGALAIGLMIILFVVIRKCSFHSLPNAKLQSVTVNINESYSDDKYQLTIENPVNCPNRFLLSCQDPEINEMLNACSPIILESKADTSITIIGKGDLEGKIKINFKWGNPELAIHTDKIKSLPYPKGKSYKLLQGNNSSPTHNSNLSRYAFDFTMSIGDTVTSTQNGYVVGVIDGYKGWGYGDKWKSYSNQIMIYDTVTHLFTMYGHLKQNGSMVEVGEYVTIGQPIALSGKTGQTSEEHLHFNALKADIGRSGLKSYPLDSIGSYKVKELKRYQLVKN